LISLALIFGEEGGELAFASFEKELNSLIERAVACWGAVADSNVCRVSDLACFRWESLSLLLFSRQGDCDSTFVADLYYLHLIHLKSHLFRK